MGRCVCRGQLAAQWPGPVKGALAQGARQKGPVKRAPPIGAQLARCGFFFGAQVGRGGSHFFKCHTIIQVRKRAFFLARVQKSAPRALSGFSVVGSGKAKVRLDGGDQRLGRVK